MNLDKAKHLATCIADTALSLAKIAFLSKWSVKVPAEKGELVILGNGPSLNTTLNRSRRFVMNCHRLAVNFAASAPVFRELKPNHYVLADPHFFRNTDNANVAKLWLALSQVDWDMNLFVPANVTIAGDVADVLAENPHISLVRYNLTPVEGAHWLENWAFARGLGMPRPRNVLIPSLMIALLCGYDKIYVAGADHSWTKTLSVDDNNNVVSIQPHFYREDEKEVKRVNTEYMHYPLHQILYSFYVAFRSYHTIQRFARHINRQIINITPESFIDAFTRKKL